MLYLINLILILTEIQLKMRKQVQEVGVQNSGVMQPSTVNQEHLLKDSELISEKKNETVTC